MGKLDNTPQPVREAIAVGLMTASVTATAAALLHEPLFLLAGAVLFGVFYFVRLAPTIKAVYAEQAEREAAYSDDETYQPILDRFDVDHDDAALIDAYQQWKQGPHDNEVRLRFLQEAILSMIDAGTIYRVEELLGDVEKLAGAEGLTDRFLTFRAECDRRIALVAQSRLADSQGK